jgi:citrate lyase subunit beta/citryl-CoA lyase
MMAVRLRRSELSVPGSNPKMIEKALASAADLVFLDLEDAVAPALKESSRANVIAALKSPHWGRKLRAIRVNAAETKWAHDDVIEVVTAAGEFLDVIILPKVKAPRDLWFFDTLLAQLEIKLNLKKKIGLEALIEETAALARVEEIAGCCPRLEAIILGFGDLSASQGVRASLAEEDEANRYPGDPWHFARARMIVAARAAGIDAIDGPFANFRDPAGYRRESVWAATLGAVGKWAIHPSQIEIANEVFAPTPKEIDLARRMCDAYTASEQAGAGAAAADGVLIDAATVRIHEAVLERARLSGRA